jgi:hypothetical protein
MTKRKYWFTAIGVGLFLAVLVFAQLALTPAGSDRDLATSVKRVQAETATFESASTSRMTRAFSGVIKASRTSEVGFKTFGSRRGNYGQRWPTRTAR